MRRLPVSNFLKRFLRISFRIAAGALLVLVALIAALPSILSTPLVQRHLRASLGEVLKREIDWSTLHASWSRGLEIEGLALGAGPAPLLKLAAGEVRLAPKVGFRNGRLHFDLTFRCRDLTAETAPAPSLPATPHPSPTPPPPAQEPLTALAEALQNFERTDWPLPVDLAVSVAVGPARLACRDAQSGRSLALDNLAFRFDALSLADKPVTVDLRSDLAVDGHPLESIALAVELKQLVTASRRIHPASARLALRADLPGALLSLEGGLADPQGFAGKVRLDLPRIMAACRPLLPASTPELHGELALDLLARPDAGRNLHVAAQLRGTQLAVRGGPLGQGRLGPLNVRLQQSIVSDRTKQQVLLTDGVASIDKLLTASWEAVVDRPFAGDPDLRVRLGPLRVDLRQALELAGPLLAAPLPVRELTGELTLRQLSAQFQGRNKRGKVALDKLAVTLPRVRLALAGGGVAADGVVLTVDRAVVPLEAMQPAGVDLLVSYGLKRGAVSGAQPLVAEGLRGTLQLALSDLDLNSASPRKVAARAALKQSLEIGRVALKEKLTVTALHQNLAAHIRAEEGGAIEVALPELKLSAAGLQATAAGKQLGPLPLTAVVTAAGVRLEAAREALPVVGRATCTLAGGDAFRLAAGGALTGDASRRVVGDGSVRVDLGRMLPLAAPFLPEGVAADGTASVTWNVAAPAVPPPLAMEENPLARAKAALGMIGRAELSVALDSRGLRWPSPDGGVSLAYLFTSQPLRVAVSGDNGPITLAGDIGFAGLGGASGAPDTLSVQSGILSLQGELAGWQSLKLRESFKAEPFGLVQRAAVTVSGLDRLLESQGPLTASALLRRLDAVATADVEAHFPTTPALLAGGAEVGGDSRAHLGLILDGGRALQLRASAQTRNFGVGLATGTRVEGLNADLRVDRRYALSGTGAEAWSPLSISLVRPLPETVAPAGEAQIADRVREDLQGRESGSRRFSIRRIAIPNSGTPLELTALQGDLLLDPEAMGLGFFQGDLLGGTVRLRSMIDLQPDIPRFAAACSFSNLQTLQLLPPAVRRQIVASGRDTELTGEMVFDAPLHAGSRDLLEGLTLGLNLRKIGTDTLERALFSLDPYERNEQLVAQRKMLRHGGLRELRAGIADGAFGLEGEVRVKGMTIALPKVERVQISELPIRKQMTPALAGIASLRRLLDLARADTLVLAQDGSFSLVRRGYE